MIKINWKRFLIDHVIFGFYVVNWWRPSNWKNIPKVNWNWDKEKLYSATDAVNIPWHRCFHQRDHLLSD